MKNLCQLASSLICLLTVLKVPALAMKVSQPRELVVEKHNVALQCKYNITGDKRGESLRVTIFKEKPEKGNEVCDGYFNTSMQPFESRGVVHCDIQPDEDSILIKFIGMNGSDNGWYFCQVEKIHPLPYTLGIGNGSWIFIKPDVIDPSLKRCPQITPATLVFLGLTGIFLLYSVIITYLHWPLGVCILGMKEAVDMKCELIHNFDEPATATWNGKRWETGPRQDNEKRPRGSEQ